MKQKIRKMTLLFRFTRLKPEMFFDISASKSGDIVLMTSYSNEMAKILSQLCKDVIVDTNGHLVFRRNNLKFLLV